MRTGLFFKTKYKLFIKKKNSLQHSSEIYKLNQMTTKTRMIWTGLNTSSLSLKKNEVAIVCWDA